MSKRLSVTECAQQHGVTRTAIHRAIKRGALPAERIGNAWAVTEEDCATYQPLRDPRQKGSRGADVRWGGTQSEEQGCG